MKHQRAHVLYRNPHLGKALIFSAVGHTVALMLLLVSPRWFPVPDTSASTMDAIEVQLFSAIVSGSAPPEPKPATSPPPVAEPETEKAAAHVSQVAEMPKVPKSFPAAVPVNEPDSVVPPKSEPVPAANVDVVPAPDPISPQVSVKELVNTLLDSIKAGLNVPEPMAPVAPLPEAPKLAKLSDMPAVLPKTMESPETSERVRETVKEALKDVVVPAPLKRLVPIQEAPKLAKLVDMPDVRPKAVTSRETKARVREMVQDTLKDISIPSPLRPSASRREASKLAKLADIPEVRPDAIKSPATQARVREVVDEALKTVTVPAPPPPVVPLPERPKLAELPDISPLLPARELADAARTKEQVQSAVARALDKVELPAPMADLEPFDVASVPPSASLAPSVYSELKVIRERNEAMADERVAERQVASDADSSGSPPTMQQGAQWEMAFAEYASRVKMVIDRNWYWQGNNNLELRVSVRFRIYPDGRATRVAIAKTSGNQIFDRAAIRAVMQLKRLPRFPADIQREFLDVEMDFSKVRAS